MKRTTPLTWGRPPLPLLPRPLREHFCERKIPARVLDETGLPADVTCAVFGADFWRHGWKATKALRTYLSSTFMNHASQFRRTPFLDDPTALPFPDDRLGSRLKTLFDQHVGDDIELMELRYGDLLDAPGVGPRQVLGFACAVEWLAEQEAREPKSGGRYPSLPREKGPLTASPDWDTEIQIKGGLARRMLMPDLREELLQLLAAALPSNERAVEALLYRFGWGGDAPMTLQQAGNVVGVTRERVRQYQALFERQCLEGTVVLPSVDQALAVLFAAAPIEASEAAQRLAEEGLSKEPFDPEGIVEAGRVLGRPLNLAVVQSQDSRLIVREGTPELYEQFRVIANPAIRSNGSAPYCDILGQLAESTGLPLKALDPLIRAFIRHSPDFVWVGGTWLWSPSVGNNRYTNFLERAFSHFEALSLPSLHEAYKRATSRHKILIPPTEVLGEIADLLPGFACDGDVVIGDRTAFEPRPVSQPEQVLLQAFQEKGASALTTAELIDFGEKAGIPPNTLNCYLHWSPFLEHHGVNAWGMRGQEVGEAVLERVRLARPRTQVFLGVTEQSASSITLAYRLSKGARRGGVLHLGKVPLEMLPVEGERAPVITEDGAVVGHAGRSDMMLYSLGPVFDAIGLSVGDYLLVKFTKGEPEINIVVGEHAQVGEMGPRILRPAGFSQPPVVLDFESMESEVRLLLRCSKNFLAAWPRSVPAALRSRFTGGVAFRAEKFPNAVIRFHPEGRSFWGHERLLRQLNLQENDRILWIFDLQKMVVRVEVERTESAMDVVPFPNITAESET